MIVMPSDKKREGEQEGDTSKNGSASSEGRRTKISTRENHQLSARTRFKIVS